MTPSTSDPTVPASYVPWRVAMADALYGPTGFYRRPEGPAGHFRTSVNASPLFAAAVCELAHRSELATIVDVGAGRGELLRALHDLDPTLRLVGVEVAPRPLDLSAEIDWTDEMPIGLVALVIANEWLDNIPLDVVERTPDGSRIVVVDQATGDERLGPPLNRADRAWLDRWWPLAAARVGARAEIGRTRDDAWAEVIERLERGIAVAVDYGHVVAQRPPYGSLSGYRDGLVVPPVPDGACDITAHVAMDACADAGVRVGARTVRLGRQRDALVVLGVNGGRPDRALALADPSAYARALSRAGQAAELLDLGGLGGFYWLEQHVDRAS